MPETPDVPAQPQDLTPGAEPGSPVLGGSELGGTGAPEVVAAGASNNLTANINRRDLIQQRPNRRTLG